MSDDVGQLLKETSEDRERIEEYKSDIEKSNRAYKSLAEDLKRLEIEKAQLESYSAGLEQRIFDLEVHLALSATHFAS